MKMPLARYIRWREATLTPSRWLAQDLPSLFYEALLLLMPMPAAILACSAVATLAALGIDMAEGTLLAGALSVGIGFCLQNVVVRPSPGGHLPGILTPMRPTLPVLARKQGTAMLAVGALTATALPASALTLPSESLDPTERQLCRCNN